MNGYVALLAFRYSNLCVKADVMSLLPVTVTIGGEETNIEQVADVAVAKENVLAVVPKDPAHLYAIGQGVMDAHPEFLVDIVQNSKSKDEEDKYLTFTMPEVDEERHATLSDGITSLHKQCKTKLDYVYKHYSGLIEEKMQETSSEATDDVKSQLKELYDYYDKMSEQMMEAKKKEIETSHETYKKTHKNKKKSQQSEMAAHNLAAGLHMSMSLIDKLKS